MESDLFLSELLTAHEPRKETLTLTLSHPMLIPSHIFPAGHRNRVRLMMGAWLWAAGN